MLSNEVFRFLLSGGSLFVLDFTVFYICHFHLEMAVWGSELTGRSVGATTGFLVHKLFTFANPKGASALSAKKQGAGYFSTVLFNLAFSPILVSALAWLLYPYVAMAKAIGSILLAIETFVVFRFLFRESNDQASHSAGKS